MNANDTLIERLRVRFTQTDKLPLYMKFSETIQRLVQTGELAGGHFLPSEREFVQALGISRITVRKALELLESQNIVIRNRGYGTYINDQLEYHLSVAQGFSDQVALKGKKPGSHWLEKARIPCEPDIAERLNISAGSPVFILKRVRDIDGEPVSIEESYVPASLIDDVEHIGVSLYAYFQSQNIVLQRTRSWVSAQTPSQEFMTNIKTPVSLPVLVVKELAFDNTGKPVEYSINYCRSDMYVFFSA